MSVIESLGDEANGGCAKLAVHLLSGDRYRVDEYDGYESVIEPSDDEWVVVK